MGSVDDLTPRCDCELFSAAPLGGFFETKRSMKLRTLIKLLKWETQVRDDNQTDSFYSAGATSALSLVICYLVFQLIPTWAY